MKKKTPFNYKIIYYVSMIVAALIIIASSLNPDEDDVRLIEDKSKAYNAGWEYEDIEYGGYTKCDLPLSLDKKLYKDLTVRRKLGREAVDGTYIMYRSVHAENHVYIGDEEIYTYATKRTNLFPLPGSAWIVIPLKDEYNGQYLKISLSRTLEKYGGVMEEVIIGDRADMLEWLLTKNSFGLVTCFLILFAGIMLYVVGIYEKSKLGTENLLYLALAATDIFIWSVNETHCTQLFMGNMEFVSIMTYESLAVLPMPFILFFGNSRHRKVREWCQKLSVLPLASFLLLNALHFLGIADMSDCIILTHASIFISGGVICLAHIMQGLENKRFTSSARLEMGTIGFFVLVVTGVLDIIHYYHSDYIDGGQYSRVGLLTFIIMLAVDSLNLTLNEEIEVKRAEVYKELAFTDSLTGLGNRQAYENELERIDERDELLEHLVVGILDLNNLKRTNDSMGHAEGDKYIIQNATFIMSYFSKIAKMFRIGGDEFAIVFTGHDSDVFFETEAKMFDDIMAEGREDINFAYGSAAFNRITDKSTGDTIRRADAKMYGSKKKYQHNAELHS